MELKWKFRIAAPPIVRTVPARSIFALMNSTISMDCLVESTKTYTLAWKRELPSSVLVEPNMDRTDIDENGTLKLKSVI